MSLFIRPARGWNYGREITLLISIDKTKFRYSYLCKEQDSRDGVNDLLSILSYGNQLESWKFWENYTLANCFRHFRILIFMEQTRFPLKQSFIIS